MSCRRHQNTVLFGIVLLVAKASTILAVEADYIRDVRPILAENCFHCHGADEAALASGLRLDQRHSALHGGDSGEPAIVPGDPDSSRLIVRVSSDDEAERMPPADAKPKLEAEQIEILRQWIAAGAEYREHWAFIAPTRPQLPDISDEYWVRSDMDRFVLHRLDQEQLQPSPEASRRKLLRRLSLDLIGLPPSPEEIARFLSDTAADAYERQVERLLASPHFGEKWARHWLDVARYADSDGYEKDLPRKQHLWRDWVIEAINEDMPYDDFIIEQVAGDLLPGARQSQRVATGFLRNGMVNEEGAIIHEQFRLEGLFDRMDCLGKAVIGLTVQCAQCHSHKYDPISHEEYYRLLAFLNNDYEAISRVYTDEQLEEIAAIRREVRKVEERLKVENPDWQERLADWESQLKETLVEWEPLPPIDPEWVGGLAHPDALPDHSVLTLGFRPTDGDLIVLGESKAVGHTALQLEALTHGDLPFGGPGRSVKGTFAISEVLVESKPLDDPDAAWEQVALADAAADFEQPQQPLEEHYRRGKEDKRLIGPASFLVDGKEETAWGADRGSGRRHQDLTAVLRFKEPVNYSNGVRFKVTLRFKHGGADDHGRKNNFLGRFRLSLTRAEDPKAIPRTVREALTATKDQRTHEQSATLVSYWRSSKPQFDQLNTATEKLWASYPGGESVLNLAQRHTEHRRQTYLLDRGEWLKPTVPVKAGVPAALHSLPKGEEPNRLALARWLVDRRSPTAARVAVNRVWQALFGIGLVETSEDFGTRASLPSHPQLLDWLAVEFMERGWSLKQLLRTIVTTTTYRQSSHHRHELHERDPSNRLLARGPRFRVEAEVARDTVLAASGLLNRRVGGPSFFPPVPESIFATSFIKVDFWETAPKPKRYRRSLYVFRRRSMPDPVLAAFDAPSGDLACARRMRSNTPLAALTALNETVFVEGARAMALRILREADSNDRDRASYAFMLCTSRQPNEEEVNEVLSLRRLMIDRLAEGWLSPRAMTTGNPESLPELPDGVTPSEAAAWTAVARVLLNLDETITKD